MTENIIIYIVVIIWITFHCYCLFHYGNKLRINNKEKKNQLARETHEKLIAKGFKHYHWVGEYNYTVTVLYKSIKTGCGYYRDRTELCNFLKASKINLTFCREI